MAARQNRRTLTPKARGTILRVAASVAVFGVLVGGAIVAQGFDVKQTPLDDSSIWALQNIEGKRYARVNTDLGELDTVKSVIDPTELVQTESSVLVVAESNNKLANVSLSKPNDIASDSEELQDTPSGTSVIVSSDKFVGYLTAEGEVFAAPIDAGADTQNVDPYAGEVVEDGEEPRRFNATAIAIDSAGILYSFSTEEASLVKYDLNTGKLVSQETVADVPDEIEPTMTVIGDNWVIFDAKSGQAFGKNFAPVDTGIDADGVLQQSSASGDRVYIASPTGLVSLDLGSGERADEYSGENLGRPAAPASFNNQVYAAWVTSELGTLWNSLTGESALGYNGQVLPGDAAAPAFRSNGARMILNDTSSGWVWTIPDGEIIPSSQDWTFGVVQNEETEKDADQAKEVIETKPPIAVDDQFGVRAGSIVTLPVMLNDHDPNKDVLTIVPDSVNGLSEDFGTATVTNNNQSIVVNVSPDATGSKSFNYTITDGTRKGGLLSAKPGVVTLTVHDSKTNGAPVWCVERGCKQDWFEDNPMQVEPGGSTTVRVLDNWVDPDGDAMFVKSVVKKDPDQTGKVAATPDGTVVFQHPNPSASAGGVVNLIVTVADVTGKTTERSLPVYVVASPNLASVPFAAVTRTGEPITIDPTRYLTGVSGAFSITAASTGAQDGSKIALRDGGTTFDFAAGTAGDYIVNYTVEDAATKLVSVVRISVVEDGAAKLTSAPVTVFLRPRLDSTVDVFSAVSNPAGKVLLLNSATDRKLQKGANLDVSVVDHRLLRVKGSTVDGKPGTVGVITYTLTDGTGATESQVTGAATVVLLAAPTAQAPIAVNDAITVRANSQIDIPVLDNDVSGDGNSMVLNPDDLKNPSKKGLAFVSGSVIRYLAPDKAGTYRLNYAVYSAGSPKVADSAAVTVTVLPGGENRPPQPRTLVGRVLAGETVEIPFDGERLDPDGDTVILERIVEQPETGTATVSLDGDAIVYTSVTGFKGPVEFTYSVKDALGDTATAKVRVGVLEDQSDPSPVTFSDYVEVQQGEKNFVEVFPSSNDLDPAGKALKLVSVTPDAAKSDLDEYNAIAALIQPISKNGVKLFAGTSVGTKTFQYQIENSTGDTAAGYITMKVVREAVPDRPRVQDTYLSLADRATFDTGIDVVTGKVSWLSGDPTTLALSLWQDLPGLQVEGSKIKGELPDKRMLVPFQLSGKNNFNQEVSTYGFLTIPGKDDIILAFTGDATQNVKEKASVTFDMQKLMSIPTGEKLIIEGKKIPTSGQRADSTCVLETGTTSITYKAGAEKPWVDSCTVSVKLEGQSQYTKLLVPIVVEPGVPQPKLRPASRTLSPGDEAIEFDMRTMTEWSGKEDWDSVEYKAEYGGSQFQFSQKGDILTLKSEDAASPGQVENVTVTITSHKEVAPARLTLKVGPAPTELPRGSTVSSECSVDEGTSCSISVIGGPNEFNALPDTPLKLVSVESSSTCVDVKFAKDGDKIRASFPRTVAGAECSVSFVVEDAQGAQSSGEGNGTLNLDLFGYPSAPDAVEQATYDDGRITLVVRPGASTQAHPEITGFVIKDKGRTVGKCSVDGSCNVINKLVNGDQRVYDAFAENSVGLSLKSVNVIAWSYAEPKLGNVSRTPVYVSGQTSRGRGYVEVTINNDDDSVDGFEVDGYDGQLKRTGTTTTTRIAFDVGDRHVKVKPISKIPIPKGDGPVALGTDAVVRVAGLPSINNSKSSNATKYTITVNGVDVDTNESQKPTQYLYIAYTASARCYIDEATGGDLRADVQGGRSSTSSTIGELDSYLSYNVKVCASNGFGLTESEPFQKLTWGEPPAPNGYYYSVSGPSGDGGYYQEAHDGDAPPNNVVADWQNRDSRVLGRDLDMKVRFCSAFDRRYCGDWKNVGPESDNKAWQVEVNVQDIQWKCGEQPSVDAFGDGVRGLSTNTVGGTFWGPSTSSEGVVSLQPTPGNTVSGATELRDATATITLTYSKTSGLAPYVDSQGTIECDPNPFG